MKQILSTLLGLVFLSGSLFAQKTTDKINLKKDQVISNSFEMKNKSSRGEQGDMTTSMTMVSTYKVVEVNDTYYTIESSLDKAKMDFEGFGMTQSYDSEDPAKKEGMMAQAFEGMLGKKETVKLGFDGKIITEEENKKRGEGRPEPGDRKKGEGRPEGKGDGKGDGKGRRKDGGMMRMMGMGGDPTEAIAGNFLLIPADKKQGEKWRITSENEGLKTITEYTFNGLMGDLANISANQQVKGTVSSSRQGMSFTSDVNNLSTMTLLVDINTGLVTMKTVESKDSSDTQMGETKMKSTGTGTMTIINEL